MTIACDYSDIGTSEGGFAGIGSIGLGDSTTTEAITLGSTLSYLTGTSGPCFANPTSPTCAPDVNFAVVAGVMLHEDMHQHGYNHVVENYNDFPPPGPTSAQLCGIPIADKPVYNNSVPYMVQACAFETLAQSDTDCPAMYTGCGDGLSLLDSLYTGTTCSCVSPPGDRLVGAPRISAVAQTSGNDYFALDGNRTLDHQSWTPAAGFSGWQSLGGTFIGTPVAVAGANGSGVGTLDVVAQGTNGGYFHKAWNGKAWVPGTGSWDALVGVYLGGPAVVSWGLNRIDVFAEGTDCAYYHQAWIGPSSGWQTLELVGGTFDGPPTVVSRASGSIDIFGRGTNNMYYHKSYNGTAYSPAGSSTWDAVGPGTFVTDPVVAATSTHLDIFGQGTDLKCYHQSGVGGTLQSIGVGTFVGPPAAAWQNASTLDVVGQGLDGAYYHVQQVNGTWSALDAVGLSSPGSTISFGAATLLAPPEGGLNVIAEEANHVAYFKGLLGSVWSGPISFGGSIN